jgi:hypothetical protein
LIKNRAFNDTKVAACKRLSKIAPLPGRKIVQNRDRPTFADKLIYEMAADKAGTTSD